MSLVSAPGLTNGSIAGRSSSDMVETDLEGSPGPGAMGPGETITLSFDTATGGAWDDRELVNAYDAAMDEFHLHHPGPGTWLDKAMAASKVGQPLPGAKSTSTSWYSATSSIAPAVATTYTPPSQPKTKKRKTNSNHHTTRNAVAGPSSFNPYASRPVETTQNGDRSRYSPAYAPASPVVVEEEDGYDDLGQWGQDSFIAEADNIAMQADDDDDQEGDNVAHTTRSAQQVTTNGVGTGGPSFGTQPTGEISAADAMGYAMTAQYWAGYWMGVAQAKSAPAAANPSTHMVPGGEPAGGQPAASAVAKTRRSRREVLRAARAEAADSDEPTPDAGEAPSNVFITRKQFYRPMVNGLKR